MKKNEDKKSRATVPLTERRGKILERRKEKSNLEWMKIWRNKSWLKEKKVYTLNKNGAKTNAF
jgi:hypothetical protein